MAKAFDLDDAKAFDLDDAFDIRPRYNMAPSQPVAVVRLDPEHDHRELCFFRWGLIPAWAEDPSIGYKMINARADTVAEKPAFKKSFLQRRCLVVGDGFYEWQQTGGPKKQPFYIKLKHDGPFAFAGLWDRWKHGGEPIESCTIITTEPNELMEPLHDRMPVILPPDAYSQSPAARASSDRSWLPPSMTADTGPACDGLCTTPPPP